MSWTLYDYRDYRGENPVRNWCERLQKQDLARMTQRIDLLENKGHELCPGLATNLHGFPHLYKIKVNGRVAARLFLCKGPINMKLSTRFFSGLSRPMTNYRKARWRKRMIAGSRSLPIRTTEGDSMNELRGNLREEFQDKEYRQAYADDWLNTFIATQIKVLREQRELTQSELASQTGMKQPRIAVLEDVNYSSWSINTLRRLAEAFDLRLSVKFETFSSLITEAEGFSRNSLERASFADDGWFHRKPSQPAADSAILKLANNEENKQRSEHYSSAVQKRSEGLGWAAAGAGAIQ